jgi:hypothetical protein
MTAFKEFAIGKFVLRFYKTDHVWTCTVTEDMLDEVKSELLLRELSDIGQAIEQEPVAWMLLGLEDRKPKLINLQVIDHLEGTWIPLYTHPMRDESFDRTASHMADEYVGWLEETDEQVIANAEKRFPFLKKASEK